MTEAPRRGFLAWVERTGNRLPDPVFMFLYLIGGLVLISMICAAAGLSAQHPTELGKDGLPVVIEAKSLLSGDNLRRLFVDMPQTFTHFHPLGYVLVVMLGAGVAERSGLFASAMRAAVKRAPKALLTPAVAFVAIVANHAADAAYVVLIPLAGVLFAAAGRHPLVGIAAAFAGVSGGFSANIAPGQLDALLFGITQQAAITVAPSYHANIAGNWYFILGLTFVALPVIWYVTDKIIEPRLGKWSPAASGEGGAVMPADEALTAAEKKGLRWAGVAALGVVGLWVLFTLGPGTPLIDEAACSDANMAAGKCSGEARLTPLFRSLVAGFLFLFLLTGWAYGRASGSIKGHRDLVKMMTEAMKDLGYYLVLAFVAAHFVAMFNWSNLGLITAVHGAEAIRGSGLPLPVVLTLIVLFTALINLFVGSASAKWALLAPVLVPMLMLLGVSPEGATAAYRVGDSATNIITPLMVYFPLILVFCQRWQKDFGIGSLTAMMLPYALWILVGGLILTFGWVLLGADLGPGAPIDYTLPSAAPAR
ncbi:MAG: AbgT family transporter [Deltaproteobacteria bacterium]|nr:AbgT family transporter [Deltaproteobacteria bacterium]